MRIAYLLDRPELCGGVKVVFQHAELLRRAGQDALVLGRGRRPGWVPRSCRYLDIARGAVRVPSQDLVVATYWTTIAAADRLGVGPVAHFCQGYEGDYPHLEDQREAIHNAYDCPLPTLVVSPHLGEFLTTRFRREWRVTPPPLDDHVRPASRSGPRRPHRIAIHGIYECTWKGVPTGLETIRRLRRSGVDCRVIRFSLLRRSAAETAVLRSDRFLHHVSPRRAARVLRGCDLLLFPSLEAEGFGLPLLEAMASGVPSVASDIRATRFVSDGMCPLVAPGDARAFTEEASRLLSDKHLWSEARARGLERAKAFRSPAIGERVMKAVQWAVSRTVVDTS